MYLTSLKVYYATAILTKWQSIFLKRYTILILTNIWDCQCPVIFCFFSQLNAFLKSQCKILAIKCKNNVWPELSCFHPLTAKNCKKITYLILKMPTAKLIPLKPTLNKFFSTSYFYQKIHVLEAISNFHELANGLLESKY